MGQHLWSQHAAHVSGFGRAVFGVRPGTGVCMCGGLMAQQRVCGVVYALAHHLGL
jgi:hypothetical protein